MPTTMAETFRHNLWANLAMIDWCANLPEEHLDASSPGTYGRIRDTLVHLVSAEERYVIRLTGAQHTQSFREGDPFPGFDVLRAHAKASGEALVEIAERTEPTLVLRGVRNGEPYVMKATVILTQAINHATEHRAHINTILTQHGMKPADLDGWAYADAHGQIFTGEEAKTATL